MKKTELKHEAVKVIFQWERERMEVCSVLYVSPEIYGSLSLRGTGYNPRIVADPRLSGTQMRCE